MRTTLFAAALLLAVSLAGCLGFGSDPPPPAGEEDLEVRLELIVEGLDRPVHAVFPAGDASRTLVVEQPGVVEVVQDGVVREDPLLDLRELVSNGGERGLLSVALHPEFATNGVLVAYWTDAGGDTVVARFTVDPETLAPLDAGDHDVLLTLDQPYANHNGGLVVYGPDGYLYVGLGDGGAAGDPHGHGQDVTSLLGSILRIDVGANGPYAVPEDNPLVGEEGRDEIWAYGLRNPWRFSFDSANGDLWIGDVGQSNREEVDWEPATVGGGVNYGWNVYEGSARFRDGAPRGGEAVMPVAEYETGEGGTCAVTGGYVYGGSSIIDLSGAYVFGDYCSGTIWTLRHVDDAWNRATLLETDLRITSFAETPTGELVVIDHGGALHRLVEVT